ncbi:hypothetical protein FA048_01550 [Pedobacter polaris]|uniref:Carboxypeptidase regulatory-like domain-containing protein n=1 Tax=Pedobacter polaris TaxID=2571273 RepID=A0A4U1CT55_9SPHI|nr:hypothetical protein [Pedobacter polaris]TKC12331.1 hypothetical protein FA048_01550 [Pedobacter polaris]
MKTLYLVQFIFLVLAFNSASAQTNKPANKVEAYYKILPTEKLYLSFDKPYYSVGDTLWFKSFLLNGDNTASTRTDKIYVELFNDSLKFIENRVIALNNGLGYGDFALTNKLKEGTYVIRAYSNWQQNFGNDYFFQKSFNIGNAGDKTWLLNSYQQLNTTTANRTLDLKVRITSLKNEAIGLKDVEVSLMNGNKRLAKAELQTKLDGTFDTQIPLSNNIITGNTSIIIVDKKDKSRKTVLPVLLQKQDQLDLQFMPEGGYMVNDIFGKVAFKAIGNDGLGKDISGKIINSKNETIAELTSVHKGMGSFYLLPTKGESYTAIYNLNGKEQKQILPIAKEEGTTLRIDQLSKKDSLYLYVKASEGKRLEGYQLMAQSAGEILININLNLKNGFSTLKLPKQDFPDGIIHFTLFSPEALPVNERQVFINQNQIINVKISTSKSNYKPRDSVDLEITATKEDGSPLSGSFSVAITDNGQIKQVENDDNIISHFLLQSDVKGNIESPAWYFQNQAPSTLLALDHLLLAQGWIGHNWDIMLQKAPEIKFKAEKDNTIEGKLTGLFNKPTANVNLTLLSLGKNIFVTDTISNADGKFTFKNLPLLDSAAYTIKIKNAKGKTSNATINVDEFIHAPDLTSADLIKPWYVNSDSTQLNYYKTSQEKINEAQKKEMIRTGTLLDAVEIKGQARLKNFIVKTAWDARTFKEIKKEDLEINPQKKLLDLLREKIDGFGTSSFWTNNCSGRISRHDFINYVVGGSLISHVMIDKINTHIAASGIDDQYNASINGISNTALSPDVYQTNNYIFNTLKASDIVDITVFKGCAYFFLDITTRAGRGPFTLPNRGVYVYRPLPLYMAKDFYSPKYATNKGNSTPDLRSTIFWDANVATDSNGKAKISFYTADKPSTYTIKIQGTDLFGRLGYKQSTIVNTNQTESK